MNIRATILKLLTAYTPEELLRHLANELETKAKHYETVGAPIHASFLRRQADAVRDGAYNLASVPYGHPRKQ